MNSQQFPTRIYSIGMLLFLCIPYDGVDHVQRQIKDQNAEKNTFADVQYKPKERDSSQLDRFGGTNTIKGEKTGKWHIERIGGRYWWITPEGNGYYLLGVNHIHNAQEESEQEQIRNQLATWGFTSAGYEPPAWLETQMPHIQSVSLHSAIHWLPANRFHYVDVFNNTFANRVDRHIRQQCMNGKDNVFKIGYILTDTPRYDLDICRARRGTDWVSFIRQLGAETAGKQAYVSFLRKQYDSDIDKFRQAYRIENVNDFDELLSYAFTGLELKRSAIRRDDESFLAIITEHMYQLARKAFDQYDPSALVFSERFKMLDHPEKVLKVAAKYCDVISIQAGPTHGPDVGQGPDEFQFDPTYWQDIYQLVDKPILICDHATVFRTPAYPRTLWHQFETQTEAGTHYDEYLNQVISQDFIIGYQRCQFKSRYDPLRDLLKQGLLDTAGKPYETYVNKVSATNHKVIEQLYKLDRE